MKLGQKVSIDAHLVRKSVSTNTGWRKEWHPVVFPNPVSGVLVGFRTLSDGDIRYWPECPTYEPTQHFRVALVATSLYQEPKKVLISDVKEEKALISKSL